MKSRSLVALAVIAFFIWGIGPAKAGEASAAKGKKVADFSLKDTNGREVSLESLKDKKAVVVIFIGTECPINNAYLSPLGKMAKEYASQSVQFLGVNSNCQDDAAHVTQHAKENSISFPVLKDDGNKVADDFAAQRTP